jgi:hypothetical protein
MKCWIAIQRRVARYSSINKRLVFHANGGGRELEEALTVLRMAVSMKAQSSTVETVVDFVFDLRARDRLVARGADAA